jgi:hypothetical protein
VAQSRITVTRTDEIWQDRRAVYRVKVDGRRAGELRAGRPTVIDVASGTRRIRVTTYWCRSDEIEVTVGPGECATVACRGSGAFTAFFRAVFAPGRYLSLDLVEVGRMPAADGPAGAGIPVD